ncbi:MAG: RNB domain-containing ribonuclease [Solirubrobacterales bacterium]|nr:RNB domain-containing ribonuclease [Solirubrobacterales bacterium]
MARPHGRPGRLDLPFVAQLGRRGRMLVAEPFFRPGGRRVEVARGSGRDGDLVLVSAGKRGAKVIRALGRPEVARDVVEALMADRGLRRSFPRRAETEAMEVGMEIGGLAPPAPPEPGAGRADLRELPTFTIDPDDARDFDDAISARRLDDGAVRLWVHIADVTAYVRPGGRIDGEALRRGTSTYVPGAVEPMLPERLSNGACSLRPGEDRLAVTVELDMDGVDARRVAFHRSLIRSDARLTYGEVDAVLDGRARAAEPWGEPLAAARAVAAALRERRDRRGSLEVDSLEPRFRFDRDGNVEAVVREAQTEAHTLIEELMILANEQVAGYLAERRLPTLYRVHERPNPLAVEAMVAKLAALEVPVPALPEPMSPQQAADAAAEASRLAAAHARTHGRGRQAFGSLVLRSLKQAYYSPRNVGHAGLASPRYCHFTSPIRRYPDVVAHRALLAGLGLDDAAPRAHELDDLGVVCSEAERSAMRIERDADDVCLAFLLERTLAEAVRGGEPAAWEGEVVGLIPKGWFVRFGEQGFEGFLPVRRMSGWFEPDEHESALIDVDSGRALRIGDPVAVTVARIETHRGRVDLEPAV